MWRAPAEAAPVILVGAGLKVPTSAENQPQERALGVCHHAKLWRGKAYQERLLALQVRSNTYFCLRHPRPCAALFKPTCLLFAARFTKEETLPARYCRTARNSEISEEYRTAHCEAPFFASGKSSEHW